MTVMLWVLLIYFHKAQFQGKQKKCTWKSHKMKLCDYQWRFAAISELQFIKQKKKQRTKMFHAIIVQKWDPSRLQQLKRKFINDQSSFFFFSWCLPVINRPKASYESEWWKWIDRSFTEKFYRQRYTIFRPSAFIAITIFILFNARYHNMKIVESIVLYLMVVYHSPFFFFALQWKIYVIRCIVTIDKLRQKHTKKILCKYFNTKKKHWC